MVRAYSPVLLTFCVMTMILLTRGAVTQAAAQAARMTPSVVKFAAWDGVEITLLQVDLPKRHLVFEVKGQETTSVTATTPLRLGFDASIVRAEVLEAPQPLRMDSLILDQTATFTLNRDPFAPPQAWMCRVMIAFTALPSSGHMRIGAGDRQSVTYILMPTTRYAEPSRPAS